MPRFLPGPGRVVCRRTRVAHAGNRTTTTRNRVAVLEEGVYAVGIRLAPVWNRLWRLWKRHGKLENVSKRVAIDLWQATKGLRGEETAAIHLRIGVFGLCESEHSENGDAKAENERGRI